MNDIKLKLALAKMLPEMILASEEDVIVGFISQDECEHEKRFVFRWKNTNNSDIKEDWFEITDKEWLHVCWLIERGLNSDERMAFAEQLRNQLCDQERVQPYYEVVGLIASASWQQCATALIASKGE